MFGNKMVNIGNEMAKSGKETLSVDRIIASGNFWRDSVHNGSESLYFGKASPFFNLTMKICLFGNRMRNIDK